jgi:hypothetical protein
VGYPLNRSHELHQARDDRNVEEAIRRFRLAEVRGRKTCVEIDARSRSPWQSRPGIRRTNTEPRLRLDKFELPNGRYQA